MEYAKDIFVRGGPVMWPLLLLSVLSVALSLERLVFWTFTHGPGRSRWFADVVERLRAGDEPALRAMIARDRSVYSRVVHTMLGLPVHEALAVELVERHRGAFERFSGWLSTIITAAPLLGILGTVTGIIKSFDLLGRSGRIVEIEKVATGIAEALITTAFGLVITLVALFPYMYFRSKIDRAMGSIELLAAARLGAAKKG